MFPCNTKRRKHVSFPIYPKTLTARSYNEKRDESNTWLPLKEQCVKNGYSAVKQNQFSKNNRPLTVRSLEFNSKS